MQMLKWSNESFLATLQKWSTHKQGLKKDNLFEKIFGIGQREAGWQKLDS